MSDSSAPNNLAAYIWSLADLLRGDFKQSQYGRIILPFTLLRRLECVLEDSKDKVLAEIGKLEAQGLTDETAQDKILAKAAGHSFYNRSQLDLSTLGESDIATNLNAYVQGFSADAREIFEHFKFAEFVDLLGDSNLLYKVVQKVRGADLSPKAISNHDMGLAFEELIRRFAESSNETAGEHFTPRDIIRLTTAPVFCEDDDALAKQGIIRTIYDPTAGTGGFLSAGMEYVHELNPQAVMRAFGSGGAIQQHFNIQMAKNLKLATPSVEEQNSIVELLKHKIADLDLLTEKAKLQIELLQERRTALISSAVTGKIDVRSWEP